MFGGTGSPVPSQDAALVSSNWPSGNVDARMANFLCQAQQKWSITAVTNSGGYLGAPYFKITIAGTDRTLAATEDAELVVLPVFTGATEQLWRIEQTVDGSYRIMPKGGPKSPGAWTLAAVGSSSASLEQYDVKNDRQRWSLKAQ